MSKRTITAQFTEPGEYVAELRRDKELAERGVVRVTKTAQLDSRAMLTNVCVESSAIVEGRVVRLHVFRGALWGVAEADEAVQEKASGLVRKLESELLAAGLEIRAGLWRDV